MAQHFGARLRQAREARGLTGYMAAIKAGVRPQVVYTLEKAATLGNVQVRTLRKLAQVYGVTMDYLAFDVLDEDEEEEGHAA